MVLESIHPSALNAISLHGRVFIRLENDILNGHYKPGDSLSEMRVAEELGVSRTPVREAIRQLELEGLLAYVPNKGAIVKGMSEEDIRDIYEIRMKMEGLAAKRAAVNITPTQATELKEILEFEAFYTHKGDAGQILQLDSRFHELIFKASGSRLLDRTLSSFHHYIQRARSLALHNPDRAQKALEEHEAIMNAIVEGHKDDAERLMEEHIRNASENHYRLMNPLDASL